MIKIVRFRKIFVDERKIPTLMKKFGASKSTIYNALRYHTNSELASLIREAAINEFGGVEGKDVMKIRTYSLFSIYRCVI